MARDYGKEYREYHGKPEQVKDRASRNAARAKMVEKHGPAACKGKDVHHRDGDAKNNAPKNLKLEKPAINRARKGK